MRTIKCAKHSTLIIVLEPSEEGVFSSKLDATVVFYDSRRKPYLKRYVRGKCDEDCSVVRDVLAALEPAIDAVEQAGL